MEKRVEAPDARFWSRMERKRRRELRRLERSNGTRYSYTQLFLKNRGDHNPTRCLIHGGDLAS